MVREGGREERERKEGEIEGRRGRERESGRKGGREGRREGGGREIKKERFVDTKVHGRSMLFCESSSYTYIHVHVHVHLDHVTIIIYVCTYM